MNLWPIKMGEQDDMHYKSIKNRELRFRRDLQFQSLQNIEDLRMHYAIGRFEHCGKQSSISEQ